MNDPGIHVTRSALEDFSRLLLKPGVSPLELGCTKDWLDKTFRAASAAVIRGHAWENYLTIFLHENRESLIPIDMAEIHAMALKWHSRQKTVGKGDRHACK